MVKPEDYLIDTGEWEYYSLARKGWFRTVFPAGLANMGFMIRRVYTGK